VNSITKMIEILFYAAIAVFFFFQYRKVLGQRPDDTTSRPYRPDSATSTNVITLPAKNVRTAGKEGAPESGETLVEFPASLSGLLMRLKHQDPSFSEKKFLSGARKAFEKIVTAYADGDTETLRPLLGDSVFAAFSRTIEERHRNGQRLAFTLHGVKDADILKIDINGTLARIQVQFHSEETSVLTASDGSVVEGDANDLDDARDIWVFERDLAQENRIWRLVETQNPA
jgi:predicted lipid-binding transport protein (Tim44 family)